MAKTELAVKDRVKENRFQVLIPEPEINRPGDSTGMSWVQRATWGRAVQIWLGNQGWDAAGEGLACRGFQEK